jgi:prepilin-type N-terminal cleavage/methylation domain-containing protein
MSNGRSRSDAGFSLIELIISTGVLLIVSSIVTSGLLQMTWAQRTISNRTDMHSSVRSATELLQQEVGQAGRITLPADITLVTPVNIVNSVSTVSVSSVTGLFVNELLEVNAGGCTDQFCKPETVKITAINSASTPPQITINHVASNFVMTPTFLYLHATGAKLTPLGGFGTGVVPPSQTNGSTGSVLKLYGDINGDNNMVYVEYVCDTSTNHALYRRMVAWDATSKPALTPDLILLPNVWVNPPQTSGGPNLPCFQYQVDLSGNYVLDVAVTLTVQTERTDPVTKQKQTETKALLNVSPRDVIGAWQAAGGNSNRVQPMPDTIKNNLLP